MKKRTLCVIFGGKSSEYFVSLRSAFGVLSHLDGEKYDIVRVGITRGGAWYLFDGDNGEILADTWHKGAVIPVTLDVSSGQLLVLDKQIYAIDVDVFFPVMHGEYVEDGRLQGLFDICGVKYVGCGAFASHICMDKALTKDVAKRCGIRVSKGVGWEEGMSLEGLGFAYPVFVKPCMGGSSVGVCRVKNEGELRSAIERARLVCPRVLIEEEIVGREVEVGVLEAGGKLTVSPVGMIRHGGEFYGYEEKYNSLDNEYIIPAPMSEKTAKYIQECAKKLFLRLGCRGLSRFDFFVLENGDVVFNEVNTMPGFTEGSMFPMLFRAEGMEFERLLDCLLQQ